MAYDYYGPVPPYPYLGKQLFYDLLNPSPYCPISSFIRDPFWWKSPYLRPYYPYNPWGKSPFYLRDSYLSPVKRKYLWSTHPIRPYAAVY